MAQSNIFICYRRSDSAAYAGRLNEDLREHFVGHAVFMDLGIGLGLDFVEQVEDAIASSAVLLVLIGPDWSRSSDDEGRRRLEDPDDLVRLEIATALERDLLVIPLLVRDARMPKAEDLPAPLARLARRNGFAIRDDRWDDDVAHLVRTLERLLDRTPPVTPELEATSLPGLTAPAAGPTIDGDGGGPASVAKRRLRVVALLALLVVLGGVGASLAVSGDADAPDVKVGALYSLSGSDAAFGKDVLAGAQLAVDYINGPGHERANLPVLAGGGLPHLGKAKIKLVVSDLEADRCTVQSRFSRLVARENVAAVIGSGQSTYTLRAVGAADAQKRPVPLVNDVSSAPTLTADVPPRSPSARAARGCDNRIGRRPSPWFFRVGPDDERAAKTFFKLIAAANAKQPGRVARVAILHESNDIFGNSGAAVTYGIAKRSGLGVRSYGYSTVLSTSRAHAQLSRSDPREKKVVAQLRKQLARIKRYEPDLVIALSYEPDAVAMVQTMQSMGYHPPMLAFGTGFALTSFIPNAVRPNSSCKLPGTVPARIIVRTPGTPDSASSPLAATIRADWAKTHDGKQMSPRAAGGFMAMLTVAQAIDDA